MTHADAYIQRLPALGLSIEHRTDRVPPDNGWYLLSGDEQLGRFRSLKAAQTAYNEAIAATGWTPSKVELSSDELVAREAQRRNNEAFFEYWYGGVNARRGRQRKR